MSASLIAAISAERGGGSAGSKHVTLTLTNQGQAACELTGFPGVSYVGNRGNEIGAAATREGSAKRVVLRHGQSAAAALTVTDYQAYPAQRCKPTAATGYRIYAPGSKDALFLREGATACADPRAPLLVIGTVTSSGSG